MHIERQELDLLLHRVARLPARYNSAAERTAQVMVHWAQYLIRHRYVPVHDPNDYSPYYRRVGLIDAQHWRIEPPVGGWDKLSVHHAPVGYSQRKNHHMVVSWRPRHPLAELVMDVLTNDRAAGGYYRIPRPGQTARGKGGKVWFVTRERWADRKELIGRTSVMHPYFQPFGGTKNKYGKKRGQLFNASGQLIDHHASRNVLSAGSIAAVGQVKQVWQAGGNVLGPFHRFPDVYQMTVRYLDGRET